MNWYFITKKKKLEFYKANDMGGLVEKIIGSKMGWWVGIVKSRGLKLYKKYLGYQFLYLIKFILINFLVKYQ